MNDGQGRWGRERELREVAMSIMMSRRDRKVEQTSSRFRHQVRVSRG